MHRFSVLGRVLHSRVQLIAADTPLDGNGLSRILDYNLGLYYSVFCHNATTVALDSWVQHRL